MSFVPVPIRRFGNYLTCIFSHPWTQVVLNLIRVCIDPNTCRVQRRKPNKNRLFGGCCVWRFCWHNVGRTFVSVGENLAKSDYPCERGGPDFAYRVDAGRRSCQGGMRGVIRRIMASGYGAGGRDITSVVCAPTRLGRARPRFPALHERRSANTSSEKLELSRTVRNHPLPFC